jgi:hypothetical protein
MTTIIICLEDCMEIGDWFIDPDDPDKNTYEIIDIDTVNQIAVIELVYDE